MASAGSATAKARTANLAVLLFMHAQIGARAGRRKGGQAPQCHRRGGDAGGGDAGG
jgi:hypothetical protein